MAKMRKWNLIFPLVLIALTTTPSGALGDEVTVVNSQFQVAAGKSACSSVIDLNRAQHFLTIALLECRLRT